MRRKRVNDGACNREYFRVAAAVEEFFFIVVIYITIEDIHIYIWIDDDINNKHSSFLPTVVNYIS